MMYPQVGLVSKKLITKYARKAARQERKKLLKTFWLVVIICFFFEALSSKTPYFSSFLGANLITFAAFLPSYFWCSGKALGFPLFPIYALTYLWTHAIPILNNTKTVTFARSIGGFNNSADTQFLASATTAGFLCLGTFVWLQFVKTASKPPKIYRAFNGKKGELFFFFGITFDIIFNMARIGGWLNLGKFYPIITGISIGLSTLSIFVLSYRFGAKEISKIKAAIFLGLFITLCLINALNFALVGSLGMTLLAVLAYIASSQKLPWKVMIIAFLCFSLLHMGKGDMRAKYWWGHRNPYFQPFDYPALYEEWIGYSFKNLHQYVSNSDKPQTANSRQSLVDRGGLIQLLVLIQEKTPKDLPYLNGSTYATVPKLLIPRFLNDKKIASHEGTYILSIYYGLQTRADTRTTTIGWGLLNEAYANFGFLGCTLLAVILGSIYGQATRWSMHTPLLAARSLFSVVLLSFAFQTEFIAGVYVSSLFQATGVLVVISFVFMENKRNQETQVVVGGYDYQNN